MPLMIVILNAVKNLATAREVPLGRDPIPFASLRTGSSALPQDDRNRVPLRAGAPLCGFTTFRENKANFRPAAGV